MIKGLETSSYSGSHVVLCNGSQISKSPERSFNDASLVVSRYGLYNPKINREKGHSVFQSYQQYQTMHVTTNGQKGDRLTQEPWTDKLIWEKKWQQANILSIP